MYLLNSKHSTNIQSATFGFQTPVIRYKDHRTFERGKRRQIDFNYYP